MKEFMDFWLASNKTQIIQKYPFHFIWIFLKPLSWSKSCQVKCKSVFLTLAIKCINGFKQGDNQSIKLKYRYFGRENKIAKLKKSDGKMNFNKYIWIHEQEFDVKSLFNISNV